jgi:hypothetical protein
LISFNDFRCLYKSCLPQRIPFIVNQKVESIVLKLGLIRRLDPELKSSWVEEKTGEEKTRQDPVKNPVAIR